MIFDSHVHIERGLREKKTVAWSDYDLEVDGKNLICNFPELLDDYRRHVGPYDSLSFIFGFRERADLEKVGVLLASGVIQALKVHSRIQRITRDEYGQVEASLREVSADVPVILDAWYYGSDLAWNPSLEGIIEIIRSQPERRFLIAHAGGYRIIEFFYHTRELENVSYDLSLSTQYLADSSLFTDLKKFLRWIPTERILFGSDYPYASPRFQYEALTGLFDDLGWSADKRELVLSENAKNLFAKCQSP